MSNLPALTNARTLDDVMGALPDNARALVEEQLGAAARTPAGQHAERAAAKLLSEMLPPDRAAVAVKSIGGAVSLISRSTPQIADVMRTQEGRQSLALAVAMVALTGFSPGLPGMPGAKAYLIPRKARGVQVVNWQVSAAGLRHMAAEDGYIVTAIPVFAGDMIECPSMDDPSRTAWEAAPGGPCAAPGEDEPDWAPVPLDAAAPQPPRTRPVQPSRTWPHLAGMIVLGRDRATGAIHAWRWVGRDTIIVRRDASDSFGFAARDLKSEGWKAEKAAESPWIKWALEMAEKAAIAYAIRRGLVPITDRMTAVLAAEAAAAQGPAPTVTQPAPLRIPIAQPAAPVSPPPLDEEPAEQGGEGK